MPPKLRIAYIAHSLRSDWNNGNAHFLRGLMRSMTALGHEIAVFEPEKEWSIENLRAEPLGERSLTDFSLVYPELNIQTFRAEEGEGRWRERLNGVEVVILHEWNPPSLAKLLLNLRREAGFQLLFHDTHHRASSSPEQMQQFGLDRLMAFLLLERRCAESTVNASALAGCGFCMKLPIQPSFIRRRM